MTRPAPARLACQLLAASLLFSVSAVPIAEAQFNTPGIGGRYSNQTEFYTKDTMTIPARAAGHDTYSRLVFEWPERVPFTIDERKEGILILKFQRRALVNMTDVRGAPETNFGSVEIVSALNQNLEIQIKIPVNATYKAYTLGYKTVIDVQDVPGQKRGTNMPTGTEKKKSVTREPESSQPASAPPAAEAEAPPTTTVTPDPAPPPAPVEQGQAMAFVWTATQVFNAASFWHNGNLYFVTDSKDLNFPPKITIGAVPAGAIKRIPVDNGQVYKIALPASTIGAKPRLFSGGGGMAWDFSVNPDQPPKKGGVDLRPEETDGHVRLVAPMREAEETIAFTDPDTNNRYVAVVVSGHNGHVNTPYRNPDMEIIPGSAGFAVRPLNDMLRVEVKSDKVIIDTPAGLIASSVMVSPAEEPALPVLTPLASDNAPSLAGRVFYFDRWLVGLPELYTEARQTLENRLVQESTEEKPGTMIALAKFHLAYGFAPEALGYLELAAAYVPAMQQDPEFRALRGAALALIGDGNSALQDLSDPALDGIPEIAMWRAYAAAQSYRWTDAFTYLPSDLAVLSYYPSRIQEALALTLAETYLRAGKPNESEKLLVMLQASNKTPSAHREAAAQYLLGETKRLQKKSVEAIALWNKAEESQDQLYRVKATLAKTALQLQERAIKPEEAIERLERLRFAWRGDGLETQIAQVLGRLYLTNQKWDQAFELMRDAAGFAAGSQEGNAITASMTQAFAQIFTSPPKDLKATDAIALYDRFPELTPAGEEGKAVQRGLAGFLLQVDLLDRAGDVYQSLIPQGTNGVEVLNDGLQLAAVRLLAREPQKAYDVLTEGPVAAAQGTPQQARQRVLLRARALSDLKKTDAAMQLLAGLSVENDTLSLIADVAWRAGRWDIAAQSLAIMMSRASIADEGPLNAEDTDLVMNRAVALRLDDNEKELAELRATYLDKVTDETMRRQLNAITRPAQTVTLADRDTLLGIANEIDLFKSFLNDSAAKPAAAPQPAAPAAAGSAPSP